MEIPVLHPAFTARDVRIRTAGFWSGPRVLVDGRPIRGKRGTYEVCDDDGEPRRVRIRIVVFDPVPRLEIDGEKIELARPLRWYEIAWIGLPIALFAVGGAVGGGLGAGAAYANAHVFRTEFPTPVKYLLSGLIGLCATLVCLVIATVVHVAIYGIPRE